MATSGPITINMTISLEWLAFENSDVPRMTFVKVQNIPISTNGTKCVVVDIGNKVNLYMAQN